MCTALTSFPCPAPVTFMACCLEDWQILPFTNTTTRICMCLQQVHICIHNASIPMGIRHYITAAAEKAALNKVINIHRTDSVCTDHSAQVHKNN